MTSRDTILPVVHNVNSVPDASRRSGLERTEIILSSEIHLCVLAGYMNELVYSFFFSIMQRVDKCLNNFANYQELREVVREFFLYVLRFYGLL